MILFKIKRKVLNMSRNGIYKMCRIINGALSMVKYNLTSNYQAKMEFKAIEKVCMAE